MGPAVGLVNRARGGFGIPYGHYDPYEACAEERHRPKARKRFVGAPCKRSEAGGGNAPKNAAVERREASALRYWAQDASQASGMRRSACPGAAIRTAPLGALPPRALRVAEMMRSRLHQGGHHLPERLRMLFDK